VRKTSNEIPCFSRKSIISGGAEVRTVFGNSHVAPSILRTLRVPDHVYLRATCGSAKVRVPDQPQVVGPPDLLDVMLHHQAATEWARRTGAHRPGSDGAVLTVRHTTTQPV
jgi:hypothetical protein